MHTLKEIYQDNEERNFIDPSLYSRYRVKAGLRNDNGTGVKVGLTKICDVIGYKIIHEKKYRLNRYIGDLLIYSTLIMSI